MLKNVASIQIQKVATFNSDRKKINSIPNKSFRYLYLYFSTISTYHYSPLYRTAYSPPPTPSPPILIHPLPTPLHLSLFTLSLPPLHLSLFTSSLPPLFSLNSSQLHCGVRSLKLLLNLIFKMFI